MAPLLPALWLTLSLGPLIGGFINANTTWRWTFYFLLIWAGAMLMLIIILVPETYHPIILRQKAERLRKETGDERWRAPIEKSDKSISKTIVMSLYRPMQLLFLEPMCFNLCLFSAILLGILYLFFGAFPLVFGDNHGFDLMQIGLSFLGLACGMLIAVLSGPLWHKNYVRLVRNREKAGGERGGSEPEYRCGPLPLMFEYHTNYIRLPPAILGSFLVTSGLFWFAWTSQASVHWICEQPQKIVPTISRLTKAQCPSLLQGFLAAGEFIPVLYDAHG